MPPLTPSAISNGRLPSTRQIPTLPRRPPALRGRRRCASRRRRVPLAGGGPGRSGTTPDSPIYGLERAMEGFQYAFTFGHANKAKLKMQFAEERLAEMNQMVQQGKPEFAGQLQEAYETEIALTVPTPLILAVALAP